MGGVKSSVLMVIWSWLRSIPYIIDYHLHLISDSLSFKINLTVESNGFYDQSVKNCVIMGFNNIQIFLDCSEGLGFQKHFSSFHFPFLNTGCSPFLFFLCRRLTFNCELMEHEMEKILANKILKS